MRNFSVVPAGTVIELALLLQVASAGMLARQFEPAESQTCLTNCRVAEVTVTFPELLRLTPPPPGSVAWLTAAWTSAGHNTNIIRGAARIPFMSTPARFKAEREGLIRLKSQALVRLARHRSHRQLVQLTVRIGIRDRSKIIRCSQRVRLSRRRRG